MTRSLWPSPANRETLRKNPHLSLELYRHGRPEVVDLSDYVSHVVWDESISSPWQSLSVTWKAPLRDSFTQVLCGDWVILRLSAGGGYSAMLARVESVDHGISSHSGAVVKDPSTFSAVGWWAFLHHVKIFSAPDITEDLGTIFTPDSWGDTIGVSAAGATNRKVGDSLTRLFQKAAAVKLPKSLTGSDATLGDLIAVVHNEDLAKVFAPRRAPFHESVEQTGNGLVLTRISAHFSASELTVGEMLMGSFVPDASLVELFPTFERFDQSGRPDASAAQTATPGAMTTVANDDFTRMSGNTETYTTPAGTAVGNRGLSASLASKLGGWPSLLYRVKPFRTRPLREVATAWAKDKTDEAEQILEYLTAKAFPKALNNAIAALPPTPQSDLNARTADMLSERFDKITWNYLAARAIAFKDVRSFRCSASDSKRINASTFALSLDGSGGPIAVEALGLPLTYDEEIKRHGLRMAKPTWPFTIDVAKPPEDQGLGTDEVAQKTATELQADLLVYLRSVCATYLQFYKNNHLYGEGEVQINFREAPQFADTATETVAFRYFDIKPGEVISIDLTESGVPYYAYAESVRHTLNVAEGGVVSAVTTIKFSHGHWGVGEDTLAKSTRVPIKRVARASEEEGSRVDPAKPVRAAGVPPRNEDAARFANLCAGGTRGSFPIGSQAARPGWNQPDRGTTGLDTTKLPAWLKDWGLKRGFKPQLYTPEYYTTPLSLVSRSTAVGIGVNDPELIWQRVWVATAVAYVIEKYWKFKYPDAQIRILSSQGRIVQKDIAQNHVSGAAIDFSIKIGAYTVPALQTWATLKRLEQAARIPGGSKGLYLNCGPNGIQGTAWEDAGEPTARSYPAGGSSGVHYDFRGAFGRLSYKYLKNRNPLPPEEVTVTLRPLKYLWVNTKGTGESDLIDKEGSLAASTFLKAYDADIFQYYANLGALDPTLWSAEQPYIPNVMQVLGQTVSCFTGEDR